MGRRKMEDQRRRAAEKEAAGRRATDAQVLEDAERLIAAWNERQALTDHWRCHYRWLLVPVGALPCLQNDQRNRLADAGPSSRCGSNEPHSRTVVPILPAQCAFCRTGTTLANKHRRRNAGRTSSGKQGR
jgi:hypothetical protein